MKRFYSFFKQNSYQITRLWIMQVGVIIFSLIVSMTASAMDQKGMLFVASLFSTAFYLYLLWYAMTEAGSKDSVRIESGRVAYDRFYGLKVGAIAAIPSFLPGVLMLIGLLLGSFGNGLYLICYSIDSFLLPMYTGMLRSLFTALSLTTNLWAGTIAYLVLPWLGCLATWYGYAFGCKHPKKKR